MAGPYRCPSGISKRRARSTRGPTAARPSFFWLPPRVSASATGSRSAASTASRLPPSRPVPRTQPNAGRRGTGERWRRSRRIHAAGNGRLSRTGQGAGFRRYRRDAHGHRRRHGRRRALRTDRRAVRLLSVYQASSGAQARSRLPALFGHGHGTVSARPPSLSGGDLPRPGHGRCAAPRGMNTPAEDRLVTLIAESARGPRREGLFALWLMVRAAEALLPPAPVSAKNHRRRLQALEKRIGS